MELPQVPGWLSWTVSLAVGVAVGMLLGRYLRMQRGWRVTDFRSLLRPLVVALATSIVMLIVLTLAAVAVGYTAEVSGVSFTLQLAFLYSLSTRMEPIEPWWRFWRWRRPPPPLTRKQKKRRRGQNR